MTRRRDDNDRAPAEGIPGSAEAEAPERADGVYGREGTTAGRPVAGDEAAEEAPTEEELREEIRALGSKWKRALADLENYKKRVERERRRRVTEAREELLRSLVEIADDFERAIACGEDSSVPEDDPFRAGVELILRRVREVLEKHGVSPIETCGATFDPAVHEAVGHVESDDHESDEIVEEVRRGYMWEDRPLRCARVVVAK
ncbi:MAG: nucleotide exchange factor GrpE [Candidatus Eisenbacteria bacterium]|nr:nucleotide exchange factor GrpE [Candidatus Eisenbacteria bacterium]